jgi:hypothetical protein
LALTVFGVAAVGLLALSSARNHLSPPKPPGPRTLQEVAQIAEKLGLHYCSDRFSGEITGRLVVSDHPIIYERANCVLFGVADHPCWRGTVAASIPSRCFARYHDPEHGVIWGEVFLYGDPALIRTLMAADRDGVDGK